MLVSMFDFGIVVFTFVGAALLMIIGVDFLLKLISMSYTPNTSGKKVEIDDEFVGYEV
jgi:hypothetical protein